MSGTHTKIIQVDTFGLSLRAVSGVDGQCTFLKVAVIAETYRETDREVETRKRREITTKPVKKRWS